MRLRIERDDVGDDVDLTRAAHGGPFAGLGGFPCVALGALDHGLACLFQFEGERLKVTHKDEITHLDLIEVLHVWPDRDGDERPVRALERDRAVRRIDRFDRGADLRDPLVGALARGRCGENRAARSGHLRLSGNGRGDEGDESQTYDSTAHLLDLFGVHCGESTRRSDEAERRCQIDGLRAATDRQLPEDAFRVRLDGLGRDAQLVCDFLVGQPVAHQQHDHPLARRQVRTRRLDAFGLARASFEGAIRVVGSLERGLLQGNHDGDESDCSDEQSSEAYPTTP